MFFGGAEGGGEGFELLDSFGGGSEAGTEGEGADAQKNEAAQAEDGKKAPALPE